MSKELNELELKIDELKKVVDVAVKFSVNHTEIAKSVGIGYDYLRQIRNGDKPRIDNEENRLLVQNITNAYRQHIRTQKEVLASVDLED